MSSLTALNFITFASARRYAYKLGATFLDPVTVIYDNQEYHIHSIDSLNCCWRLTEPHSNN